MKRIFLLLTVFCLLIFLNACTVFKTTFGQDEWADFTRYNTFAWVKKDSVSYSDELYNQKIENEIKQITNNELNKRGLRLDTLRPDLILDFRLQIENKTDQVYEPASARTNYYIKSDELNKRGLNIRPNGTVYQPFGKQNYYSQEIKYKDGTLYIFTIDPKINKIVWIGTGEEVVTDSSSYEYDIKKGIPEIFKNFPLSKVKK